jgi:hypothetical protein
LSEGRNRIVTELCSPDFKYCKCFPQSIWSGKFCFVISKVSPSLEKMMYKKKDKLVFSPRVREQDRSSRGVLIVHVIVVHCVSVFHFAHP